MSPKSQRKRYLYATNSWYNMYVEMNLSVGGKSKEKTEREENYTEGTTSRKKLNV